MNTNLTEADLAANTPAPVPCCTLTDSELIAKARDWIKYLCNTGGMAWTMSVPPMMNRDTDMIFEELCKRLEAKNAE